MGTTTRTGPSCWASSWQASHPGRAIWDVPWAQAASKTGTLLSPLMSRNSLCKRIAGAETECPSLLDLHPDAKQDRQLATKRQSARACWTSTRT